MLYRNINVQFWDLVATTILSRLQWPVISHPMIIVGGGACF